MMTKQIMLSIPQMGDRELKCVFQEAQAEKYVRNYDRDRVKVDYPDIIRSQIRLKYPPLFFSPLGVDFGCVVAVSRDCWRINKGLHPSPLRIVVLD